MNFENKRSLFFQAIFGLLLVSGFQANAKRYSIILNPQSSVAQDLNQIRAHLFISRTLNLNKIEALKNTISSNDSAVIEDVLESSQVIIVRSLNAEPIQIDAKIGYAEPDLIHPNPTYQRYGNPADIFDQNLVPFAFQTKPWGLAAVKANEARALIVQMQPTAKAGRVMILDSGIEKLHPEFLNRILDVKDFTEDGDGSGSDSEGHGTHVAGTIAGTSMGVSPLSKIYAGKVCSEEGCSGIAIAQGLEWAAKAKVDVVNLSLGGGQLSEVEKRALETAEAAGVMVVAASGNDGQPSVSFPAASPTAFAVGAVDRNFSKADFSNWGPELDIMGPGVEILSSVPLSSAVIPKIKFTVGNKDLEAKGNIFPESPKIQEILKLPVVNAGLGKPENFSGQVVAGKAVLIQRGDISFSDKFKNAILAGAKAVVFYNNAPGLISGQISPNGDTLTIPVLLIEKQAGEQLVKAISSNLEVTTQISTELSDYDVLSGTSMATPHVSGVAALVKSANPKLTPKQVRDIIKTTATPAADNSGNKFGAGMINAEKAVAKAINLR